MNHALVWLFCQGFPRMVIGVRPRIPACVEVDSIPHKEGALEPGRCNAMPLCVRRIVPVSVPPQTPRGLPDVVMATSRLLQRFPRGEQFLSQSPSNNWRRRRSPRNAWPFPTPLPRCVDVLAARVQEGLCAKCVVQGRVALCVCCRRRSGFVSLVFWGAVLRCASPTCARPRRRRSGPPTTRTLTRPSVAAPRPAAPDACARKLKQQEKNQQHNTTTTAAAASCRRGSGALAPGVDRRRRWRRAAPRRAAPRLRQCCACSRVRQQEGGRVRRPRTVGR